MTALENEKLKVTIKSKGAELVSVVLKAKNQEYMWQGDANFWAKSSPILFPIVGGLKNNQYFFEGQTYTLPRHGFARDMHFETIEQTPTKAVFEIKDTAETLAIYPFKFSLQIIYELINNQLVTSYKISNISTSDMYFSVGAHPAFSVPIDKSLAYNDYFLAFNKPENLEQFPLNSEGLTLAEGQEFNLENQQLKLTKALFNADALVFKNMQSSSIWLKSEKDEKSLKFNFENFPYFGIWAAKNADFVCLEPWCGIADAETTNQNLTEKEGINCLAAGNVFERSWQIELY